MKVSALQRTHAPIASAKARVVRKYGVAPKHFARLSNKTSLHASSLEECSADEPKAPCAAQGMTKLEALAKVTGVVADTADLSSIAEFADVLTDATTNPSLILKASLDFLGSKHKGTKAAIGERILRSASTGRVGGARTVDLRVDGVPDVEVSLMSAAVENLTVDYGAEIVKILSRHKGRVSTELDASLSYAPAQVIYDRAMHLIELYHNRGVAPDRVYIKLATTWTGIEACRKLERNGVDCNMTLAFSFAQAIACADAGAAIISPFVGRITDYYSKHGGYKHQGEDPGIRFVKRVYAYYKANGIPTKVLAASIRTVEQALALAGCDLMTLPPGVLRELAADTTGNETVIRHLSPEAIALPLDMALMDSVPLDSTDEEVVFEACTNDSLVPTSRIHFGDANAFWNAHNADAMAKAKLDEGIESFTKDTVRLEEVMAQIAGGGM